METKTEGERSTMDLLEGCIATILSFTTPVDTCRFSLVSKSFCSAAESDAVWERFLPSDLVSIISDSQSAPSLLAMCPSKKSLYLTLSDHSIIIDSGKKSFQLEKQTGKKLYMLSARDLSISWGDTPQYWDWTTLPESRYQEVAELLCVCWFEIRGRINTLHLSSNTRYAAFLVFKMTDYACGFDNDPTEITVGKLGGQSCTKSVWLDDKDYEEIDELERPKLRSDGWLEIEMGEFFYSGFEDEEVHMSVLEINGHYYKCGFFLEGIEIRPKKSQVDSSVGELRDAEGV